MPAKNSAANALIKAFAEAVDQGLKARDAIKQAIDDPFIYVPRLDAALSRYDDAMAAFVSADTRDWPDQDIGAVRDAQALAGQVLGDLVALRDAAPEILAGQTILIARDGGVFFQEGAEDTAEDDGAAAEGDPPPCCFTRIKFKNIHNRKLKVSARHASGASVETEISRNRAKALSWTDRDRQAIPGALGRCVILEVREKRGGGWGPLFTFELCCARDAAGAATPRVGDRITLTGPAPPPNPDGTTPRPPRLTALEIDEITLADPCPEGEDGPAGTSPAGTPSSGIVAIPGLNVSPRDVYFGAHARIRFTPAENGCRDFCFVQGKIRKMRLKQPGQDDFRAAPMLSTGDRYELDIEADGRTPCYPHVSDLPDGGKEMRDYPGVKNPWGRVRVDGEDTGRLAEGTEMEVTWTFRTWVVCLNPQPAAILGYFDWSIVLQLTVRRRGRTTGRVEMTRPAWRDDKDEDSYRRVAREAPRSGGFLPP